MIWLLWAAAIVSAVLSFAAWAFLARGPRRRGNQPTTMDPATDEDRGDAAPETTDMAEERDDRDITT